MNAETSAAKPFRRYASATGLPIPLSGLVDDAQALLQGRKIIQGRKNDPVDRVGSLASAEDQEGERLIGSPFIRSISKEGCPDRVSRDPGPGFRKPSLRGGKGQKNPIGEPAEEAVGQARKGVLLGDGRFHTREPGGQNRRARGITAYAYDDIRMKGAENPQGRDEAPGELEEGPPRTAPPLAL